MFGYILDGDPSGRDYSVIDFTPPLTVAADCDRELNLMEYVRKNFREIVKGLPPESELYLVAGGHAHNKGLIPLLVLWVPPALRDNLPDWFDIVNTVNRWCEALTPDELQRILNTTYSPTWSQLLNVGKYPPPYIR